MVEGATKYTISVQNNSGDTQTIALYQTLPANGGDGKPVIWFSKAIGDKESD